MAARREARGVPRQALIHDGCVFFSKDKLSNAKPIPDAVTEEYTLGFAIVHYSMSMGIKKFKEKGEEGVTKELTQMHNMQVLRLIKEESLTYNEKKKALLLLMFLREKRDRIVKWAYVCQRSQTTGWLPDKRRDYVTKRFHGIGVHYRCSGRTQGILHCLLQHSAGVSACRRQ